MSKDSITIKQPVMLPFMVTYELQGRELVEVDREGPKDKEQGFFATRHDPYQVYNDNGDHLGEFQDKEDLLEEFTSALTGINKSGAVNRCDRCENAHAVAVKNVSRSDENVVHTELINNLDDHPSPTVVRIECSKCSNTLYEKPGN